MSTTNTIPMSPREAISTSLSRTTSPEAVVYSVQSTLADAVVDVEHFIDSITVKVSRAYGDRPSEHAWIATVVIFDGGPIQIYDVPPRNNSRISAARLAARATGTGGWS